jgi:aminobenzoyl-glutamate utilization protein B
LKTPTGTNQANQIWGFAETAMKETKSSKVLADYAQEQGFRVTRGSRNTYRFYC